MLWSTPHHLAQKWSYTSLLFLLHLIPKFWQGQEWERLPWLSRDYVNMKHLYHPFANFLKNLASLVLHAKASNLSNVILFHSKSGKLEIVTFKPQMNLVYQMSSWWNVYAENVNEWRFMKGSFQNPAPLKRVCWSALLQVLQQGAARRVPHPQPLPARVHKTPACLWLPPWDRRKGTTQH